MSTPKDDLAYIRAMIENNRSAYEADSRPLAAWGILVACGSALELALKSFNQPHDALWIWLVVVFGGWIISGLMILRNRQSRPSQTLAGRAVLQLWLGVWIAMSLVGFGGSLAGPLAGNTLIGVLCGMLGIGYFAGASLVDDRRGLVLAVAWWFVGISALLMSHDAALALLAAAMLLFQTWPALAWSRGSSQTNQS